jgi:hypothetical protein
MPPDRRGAEMPHVGGQRLGTGDTKEDAAQDREGFEPVMGEIRNRVASQARTSGGIERSARSPVIRLLFVVQLADSCDQRRLALAFRPLGGVSCWVLKAAST